MCIHCIGIAYAAGRVTIVQDSEFGPRRSDSKIQLFWELLVNHDWLESCLKDSIPFEESLLANIFIYF